MPDHAILLSIFVGDPGDELIAEELRRLDPDDIYGETLDALGQLDALAPAAPPASPAARRTTRAKPKAAATKVTPTKATARSTKADT